MTTDFGEQVDPAGADPITGAPNTCQACGAPMSVTLAITDNGDGTLGVALECAECGALYDPEQMLGALELLDRLGEGAI